MSSARVDDRLLRFEQLPARAESSDILRRVGVADHDLLQAVDARAIPVNRKESIEDLWSAPQVGSRLEQWHHAKRPLRAHRFLEQLDDEDV